MYGGNDNFECYFKLKFRNYKGLSWPAFLWSSISKAIEHYSESPFQVISGGHLSEPTPILSPSIDLGAIIKTLHPASKSAVKMYGCRFTDDVFRYFQKYNSGKGYRKNLVDPTVAQASNAKRKRLTPDTFNIIRQAIKLSSAMT